MPSHLLTALERQLDAPQAPADLAPPPRFADCRFDTYQLDPQQPGQADAVAHLHHFSKLRRNRRLWPFRERRPPGLYLDGAFGVGKTHLLAAAWHAAKGSKRYLSFAEAISLMHVRGPRESQRLLQSELVCIDEFELDDPSNTRLIDLLLDDLVRHGARIIVTSNTVPGELGHGRFAIDDFRRQLQRIASHFACLHVPGQDYRQRLSQERPLHHWGPAVSIPAASEQHLVVTASELDAALQRIPVINLRRLARLLEQVSIMDLSPCQDQFAALRLVHLVDRLYDYGVVLRVRTEIRIDQLFLPEYRDWSFAKKYRRCESRLHQLCSQEPTS
ncbi:MAG: cell division protein ZapE [Planctomycetota bacterium]